MKESTRRIIFVGFIVLLITTASIFRFELTVGVDHRGFVKSFETQYPETEAQRFAIKPIVEGKLTVMHDELLAQRVKLASLRKEIDALPANTNMEIDKRTQAFHQYEKEMMAYKEFDHRYYTIAVYAINAGYKKEVFSCGFIPRYQANTFD